MLETWRIKEEQPTGEKRRRLWAGLTDIEMVDLGGRSVTGVRVSFFSDRGFSTGCLFPDGCSWVMYDYTLDSAVPCRWIHYGGHRRVWESRQCGGDLFSVLIVPLLYGPSLRALGAVTGKRFGAHRGCCELAFCHASRCDPHRQKEIVQLGA